MRWAACSSRRPWWLDRSWPVRRSARSGGGSGPAPAAGADEDGGHPALGDADVHDTLGDPAQGCHHADRAWSRNDSEEDWTDINVAPFISSEPITTRDELAEAAATDVRRRPSATGSPTRATYVRSATSRPGRARPFTIRVPRRLAAHHRRPRRLLDRRTRPGRERRGSRPGRRRAGPHLHPAGDAAAGPAAQRAGLRRTPAAGTRPARRRRQPERPDPLGDAHRAPTAG